VLYGRNLCRSGGTEKAEDAKLPGAGIGPKQCPGNVWQKKGQDADSVKVKVRSTDSPLRAEELEGPVALSL